jgi:hypothetical protein
MTHAWTAANNHTSQSWFDAFPIGPQNFYRGLATSGFGPRENTATFTNLNAAFPNGYDVYVYVQSNVPGQLNQLQESTPLHVWAGGTGLITAIHTGDTEGDHMHLGADQLNYWETGRSAQNLANLPGGTQRGLLWPTNVGGVGNSEFGGTFTQAPLNAVDLLPLDLLSIEPTIFQADDPVNYTVGDQPSTFGDYPLSSAFTALSWHDPATRGIPVGNYLLFEDLTFNQLEILAMNIHGLRSSTASTGTGEIETGGIAGIHSPRAD